MSGVKSVIVDFGAVIRSEVDAEISQVTVDHGFQLLDFGSRRPDVMSSA